MISNSTLLDMLKAYKIDDLRFALEKNVREELMKKSGVKASDKAIINRLIKACNFSMNKSLTYQHETIINGETFFGMTEGHYILINKDGFNVETSDYVTRLNLFDDLVPKNEIACTFPLSVNVNDVKLFQDFEKSNGHTKRSYTLHPYTISVNEHSVIAMDVKYLHDCLSFCDTDTIYINSDKLGTCYKDLIFMHSADFSKYALLLPVNVQNIIGALEYMQTFRDSFNQ